MRFRNVIFALVAIVLFFGTVEALFWAAGVNTLLSERDSTVGFSENVRVFEHDQAAGLYRTPPRATAHSFNLQQFLAVKPENGLRIFVIGGSSAFGFPWGAGRAFPRVLRDVLSAALPEVTVESINAAAMSYGSHRLRILVPELLQYEPDVLVIFGGHNEYVEHDLHARLSAQQGELAGLRRVVSASRLYSAMARGYERLSAKDDEPVVPESGSKTTAELLGLDVDRDAAVGVSPAERAEVLARFEANLTDILRRAERAGVAVVLCTVPSNLTGWIPNQSVFAPDLSLKQQRRVDELVRRARQALDEDAPDRALQGLLEAQGVAPGHAGVHFWLGRAYQKLGRFDEAKRAYVFARDADARPARAESAINETIRRLANEHELPLADVERAFEQAAPNGLIGFNLFEDYVHPKPVAHRLVAFELWRVFLSEGLAGPLSIPEHQWASAFEAALGQPLTAISDNPDTVDTEQPVSNPSMLFNLAVVLENQGEIERAMEKYRACLELHPSYYLARENLARLFFNRGGFEQAARAYRGVLDDKPDRVKSLIGLGESLRRLGQAGAAEEALGVLRQAVAIDPESGDAYNSLGGTLAQLNRHAEAEGAFRRAATLDAGDADTRVNLGLSLLFQQKVDAAAEAFQAALALSPHDLRARNGMGAVLTERGDLDGAETIFREVLDVAPEDAFATSGLRIIETRRGGG